MWNEIRNIALIELKQSNQKLGFKALIFLLATFIIFSIISSHHKQQRSSIELQSLQEMVHNNWQDQPDRHPHRVSHYGSIAFREPSPLSYFDIGVSDYSGNSVFLEAHVQNPSNLSETSQGSSLMRFGRLTPSFILLIILPLLIIFQSGVSVTKERETRTLAQLISMGVNWRSFLLGKVLGNTMIFLIGVIFSLIFAGVLSFFIFNGVDFSSDLLIRSLLLCLVYFWYILMWVLLAVTVSAYSEKSSSSVVTLLGLWIIFVTFMPKSLPSLGAYLFNAPAKPVFDLQINKEIVKGGHGHNVQAKSFEAKKEKLFKEYGVSKVEDLPVNWRGIAMKEGERHSTEVYSKNYQALSSIFDKQNFPLEVAAFFNPVLMAKSLSSAISFTDYFSSSEFDRQAEEYRFKMMDKLNDIHTHHIKYENDKKPVSYTHLTLPTKA